LHEPDAQARVAILFHHPVTYFTLAHTIGATHESWKAALRSGNESAKASCIEHLKWLASQAIRVADGGNASSARRVLLDRLIPIAEEIPEVALILRDAGWREK
jgi:hypothetical protein